MKKTIKDSMQDLVKQFCDAYGVDKANINDVTFANAFFDWLKYEKEDNDAFYLEQLDAMGIDYKSNRTVEVGKTLSDSLVIPYETIIVPKNNAGLESLGKRVIIGNLRFHGNLPFIIQQGIHVDHSIPCDAYNTFMTQNPYSFDEIAEWNRLPEAYHNIVVGAYGDVNDVDKAVKKNMMYQFMEKLNPTLEPQLKEVETEDKYATIVTANKRTR